MSKEDLLRKGLRVELEEKLEALEIKADGLVKTINQAVFMYEGVESIEMELAKQSMDELVKVVREYKETKRKLKKL